MSRIDITNESDSLHGYYGWTDTLEGVYYGPGSLKTALPKLLNILKVKTALVVTGKSLYHKVSVFMITPCIYGGSELTFRLTS